MSSVLNPLLAYAAGALTVLSPCVLPLVPIVLGSAAQKHRYGPAALAAGLVVSFTLTGFLLATFGSLLGLDGDGFHTFGALLLVVVGAVLLIPRLQALAERAATPLAAWAGQHQSRLSRFGLLGQAAIGALLGLVWSPCVGPTLGAATLLASQGHDLAQVAFVMFSFGMGIATVLFILGVAVRRLTTLWRGRLVTAGGGGKKALGALIALVGIMIITSGDRLVEAWVLSASPLWLTDLTSAL